MKTKILFFLPNLNGGGAERVTINIMRMLDKNLFDVHLAMIRLDGPAFEYLPKDIIMHDLNVSRTLFSIYKLRQKIVELKPDMVYSTLIRSHIYLDMILTGLRHKPVFICRSPNSPKLLLSNNELSPVMKFLLEKSYRRADNIIVQTPDMKEELVTYHHIDRNKIQVFLNPLDTDAIDEKIKNIDNPYDPEKINVVAAGRLTRQKGFDILIKAFKEVVEKNHNFVLHLIGDDHGEKDDLDRIIDELSLRNHVMFWGYQDNPYKFYFFSDLFVLSSRWEGLPNTVLENFYLNKPVVATRCIPFMDQLIHNGKNGLLVEVENTAALAKAIINYQSIKITPSVFIQSKEAVNDFFYDLLKPMNSQENR